MSEEELFCKLFPEYVVNGKPLSPYFDLFESGYEQAETEAKERINTLEYRCENIKDTDTMELVALQRENAELKADNDARKFAMAMSEKVEKQLREENAELQKKILCECTRCVYSDSPCVRSDYGKDKNGICDHFKDVFEELKNWKGEWQEQVQKATDEGYARTLQTMQLNKAKELLKRWVELYKPKLEGYPITPIQKQTEQFLKDSEVEK